MGKVKMNSKEFKRYYMKWSNAVAITITLLVNCVILCDIFLGFDFSRNMYIMALIGTSVIFSLLSLTWISALNLESRFMKDQIRVVDHSLEITIRDLAECISLMFCQEVAPL